MLAGIFFACTTFSPAFGYLKSNCFFVVFIMRLKTILFAIAFVSQLCGRAQTLQPGFDAHQYAEVLSLAFYSSGIADSTLRGKAKDPYHLEYRSPEVGLKNRWSLFLKNDNTAVIDIRGTIAQAASWMANFYAAMIPATGQLQLNDSTIFNYQLARDPRAMVHVGWTISLAHLAPSIEQMINKYYREKHTKAFIIAGHSQGGAISFLLRSWLEYEQLNGNIPGDVVFKTYCSAAPKPGNLYYAYDFDFITRGGWAFTVVNSADWVPETPFSIQTLHDINPTNPLAHTRAILKNQKLLVRLGVGLIYSKLEKKPRKAQRKFEKYLGHALYKKGIRKILPQLKEPDYVHGNNYMRAGNPIVLMADKDYYQRFPESDTNYFVHHHFNSYYYLLRKWYPDSFNE